MHRREFSKRAATTAAALLGATRPYEATASADVEAAASRGSGGGLALGTNLSGMEWARPGLRYGGSTAPNINFTVPRKADVAYLASLGYTKNRLPVQWELLQPMLNTTFASQAVQAAIGAPGAFHAVYASYITDVLDAHAAAGIKCIIDCHNYCRYQDFVFQPDGSVAGLTTFTNPLLRPYTTDPSQVQVRIFALAPGATLTPANFSDFWTKVALTWKNHPGFGGYGLMNEPHDMPAPGGIVESYNGEDLTIWPAFARAAIAAIRAVDAANPIYVAGNGWDAAMTIGTMNPGWPLAGTNLIYEVHMYLDAYSNGGAFDYDTEAAKNYSAGIGDVAINVNTGVSRLKLATAWASAHKVKLALTETAMPIDDVRWQQMFLAAAAFARKQGVEVYTWMGGNHWPIHNHATNHVPGWHQNKTVHPAVAGAQLAAAGIARAALFDDGPGYAPAGIPVTVTVYARGNLAKSASLKLAAPPGVILSKSKLTIPAGANGQDSYTVTCPANTIVTLVYSGSGVTAPPPRKLYSLADPVAYAAGTSLADGARAILAKYSACKWDMADGYTDYLLGAPAADGQVVRAISDSGYGSSPGNAMEMLNWINKDNPNGGTMSLPVMRVTNGRRNSDHTVYDTYGFWCKKTEPVPNIQPRPRNRVPYNVEDPHFTIMALSVPGLNNTGVAFQVSKTEAGYRSELAFANSQPQANWIDGNGQVVSITSPLRLVPGAVSVVSLTSMPGAQALRVDSAVMATSAASFAPSPCTQMLIGWGYVDYYPRDGFQGNVYGVITGKGVPTAGELAVLERFLAG
ncbi:glycoside hydrolase family 5 protein [Caenimonas aquaedulcis]|uniref:Cellulase family glycosylhydrolase n=1 Tax=Caenimonas aquaedulcis TaxID=2793270 RepID=A0A931MF48_9BURK|nr:cellulase family glycosylhydrolase [Caenimonas aquaedulcis]MBG9387046.1 cellulase family glycosylhydrolase [Caenimonas aquaedulcis]